MQSFTLYNKRLNRQLRHPQIGLWYTTDFNEACDMLKACKEYVCTLGQPGYDSDFVIVDAETDEEIKLHDNLPPGQQPVDSHSM